jgi:hypothetical protein
MRRAEIIEGATQIKKALEDLGIAEAFRAVYEGVQGRPRRRDGARNDYIAEFLETMTRYVIAAQGYNEAAKELAGIFHLDDLANPSVWTEIIGGEITTSYLQWADRLTFVRNQLPLIVNLLDQHQDDVVGRLQRHGHLYSTLTVILPEEENHLSSPERLVNLLQSLQSLYGICAFLTKVPPNTLSIAALDSGGDKSIDVVGIAKAIECLKDLILSMWDKVWYFREHQTEKRIELVALSLPVLEQIRELEENGAISSEEALRMRRGITEHTIKYLKTGAIIPEMEQRTIVEPRVLMAPEQKLLSAPLLDLHVDEAAEVQATDASTPNKGDQSGGEIAEWQSLDPAEQEKALKLWRMLNAQSEPPSQDTIPSEEEHADQPDNYSSDKDDLPKENGDY